MDSVEQIDAVSLLEETVTTNGEKSDTITHEMRQQFVAKSKRLGRNITFGGITAKEILSFARNEDIKRANEQIHYAVPLSIMDYVMTIRAQASNLYGATSHNVKVEFVKKNESIAEASEKTPLIAAKELAAGKITFDCDCGRHAYWYRYIAQVGGWLHGQKETRAPNIRNKPLRGVACKHMVRVANELLNSRAIHNMLAKFIEKGIVAEQSKSNAKRIETRMINSAKRVIRVKKSELVSVKDLGGKPAPKTDVRAELNEQAKVAFKAGNHKKGMSILDKISKLKAE